MARLVTTVVVVALAAPLVGPVLAPATAARGHSRADSALARAVTCSGDVATSPQVPVLLVPGTGVSAEENWGSSYEPALEAQGHAVCLVELPDHAIGDVQVSAIYVAAAIRIVHADAGRPISVIGHSQGAMLPRAALRIWPDLVPMVDDVIGLAGVYDHGSDALTQRCLNGCVPALHQLAAGSHLLAALARRPLPTGPSYTDIGTLGDTTVTPQPEANTQAGATAIEIQDVCPGRVIALSEHALIVGDAVALALVDDALDHPGPADPSRIPASTCDETTYPGFDPDPYLAAAPLVQERATHTTPTEPPVRCFLEPTCSDAEARGLMVRHARAVVHGRVVIWRARILRAGRLRLELPARDGRGGVGQESAAATRRVRVGAVTVRVPLASGVRDPRSLLVKTRPRYFTVYADEGRDPVT